MTKTHTSSPSFKQQQLKKFTLEPIKIISFPPYYPPHLGGLEKFAADLDNQFAINGHHVTVFTSEIAPPNSGHRDSNLINIIRYPAHDIIFGFPIPKIWSPKFWKLLMPLIKTKHDIVFSTTRFFPSSCLALAFAKLTKTPWIHIEHGSDYVKSNNSAISIIARVYDETIGRVILKLSNSNIAPSFSAQQFIKKFDNRISPIIYRGVNQKEINAIKPDQSIKNLHPNKTIITFAGRFIDGKGISDLLEALSRLPRDKYIALLIGSGQQKKKIKELTEKLNLSNQVIFLGQKSHNETIALLKASDIFVNPSYNEGLPTSILEASLSGCAILATNVGGTPEIVTHNKSAILFAPKDVLAMSKHLLTLISNENLRHKLSQTAATTVTNKFNWQNTYEKYMIAIANTQK